MNTSKLSMGKVRSRKRVDQVYRENLVRRKVSQVPLHIKEKTRSGKDKLCQVGKKWSDIKSNVVKKYQNICSIGEVQP